MKAKVSPFDPDTNEIIDENVRTAEGNIIEGGEAMVSVDLFRENFNEPLRI